MTQPNYAAEGRIREACAAAGVRIECLEDVVRRFRADQFTEAELSAKIEEWRGIDGHHFFSATRASIDAEAVAAFGPDRTLRAQGGYVRKHGEAAAAEIAAKFNTTVGGKPGKTPESFKPAKPDANAADLPTNTKNPWSAENWSVTRQGSLVKSLGLEKAAAIARAAGCRVGDTKPARSAA